MIVYHTNQLLSGVITDCGAFMVVYFSLRTSQGKGSNFQVMSQQFNSKAVQIELLVNYVGMRQDYY